MPENPWVAAAAASGTAENPWVAAATVPGENPWVTAAAATGAKSSGAGSSSRPPMFARTPTTNPVIEALRAGNAFGKHLAATGKFGIPDQAGEDADDANDSVSHHWDVERL